ncbi:MAG: hypothetical protein H6909_04890 [Rickettsiaceae bacterium]|nr:hypothetical protein [Rickettsiaceae bacterium]
MANNYNAQAEEIIKKFTKKQKNIQSFGNNIGMLVQNAVETYNKDKPMASIIPNEKLALEALHAKRKFKLNDEKTQLLTSAINFSYCRIGVNSSQRKS